MGTIHISGIFGGKIPKTPRNSGMGTGLDIVKASRIHRGWGQLKILGESPKTLEMPVSIDWVTITIEVIQKPHGQ